MFTKSAKWYDAIDAWKDHKLEAERLHTLIRQHARRHAATLLDVACGTGQHLPYLRSTMRTKADEEGLMGRGLYIGIQNGGAAG